MAEFKVGDRVRVKEDAECRLAGETGRLEEKSETSSRFYDFEFVPDKGVGHVVHVDELEPIVRKDTPAVGDTVRVVLEGRVTYLTGKYATLHDGYTDVALEGDVVKSLEILEPPKPSVKDLPAYAFVQNMETGEVVRRRGRTDTWVSMDNLSEEFTTGEIDHTNWAQLVPQESE